MAETAPPDVMVKNLMLGLIKGTTGVTREAVVSQVTGWINSTSTPHRVKEYVRALEPYKREFAADQYSRIESAADKRLKELGQP